MKNMLLALSVICLMAAGCPSPKDVELTPEDEATTIRISLRIMGTKCEVAVMALMALMWFLWPSSTGKPVCRSTPRDVPKSVCSTSWTATALPPSSTCTNPARVS